MIRTTTKPKTIGELTLRNPEYLFPQFIVDRVSEVIAVWCMELQFEPDCGDYKMIVDFAQSVTNAVLNALSEESR